MSHASYCIATLEVESLTNPYPLKHIIPYVLFECSKILFQDVQKFHRRFTRQSIATRTSDFDKILKIIQEKETGLSKIEINFRK